MPRPLRWSSGMLIGLIGAAIGVLVLLLAGLLTGQGGALITEAGTRVLPHAMAAGTGLSPLAAYLVIHTAFYVAAGLAAVLLTRVADRAHAVMAGLLLVIIGIEFGFLVLSTMAVAEGRIDVSAWPAFLVAHGAADVAFALLVLRAHPSLLRDLREAYEM
jgi:hypothetical protein